MVVFAVNDPESLQVSLFHNDCNPTNLDRFVNVKNIFFTFAKRSTFLDLSLQMLRHRVGGRADAPLPEEGADPEEPRRHPRR